MSGSRVSRLRLIGILFWLAGGVAITLGWMGMAAVACVDCQMPYILSGGAGGIGLVIVGSTLVIISVIQESAERTAERMVDLLKAAAAEDTAEADDEIDDEEATESGAETRKADKPEEGKSPAATSEVKTAAGNSEDKDPK